MSEIEMTKEKGSFYAPVSLNRDILQVLGTVDSDKGHIHVSSDPLKILSTPRDSPLTH